MLLAPPEWTRRAACQGLTSGDWDPWTPDVDSSFQWAVARRVCARCPVRLDCALDAIAQLEDVAAHSMRGGLTPVELKRVAHRLDQPTRLRAAHGSRSRYVAGCRCSRCRHAHAVYEHDRRLHQSAKEGAGQRPRTLTQRVVNALSTTAPRSAGDRRSARRQDEGGPPGPRPAPHGWHRRRGRRPRRRHPVGPRRRRPAIGLTAAGGSSYTCRSRSGRQTEDCWPRRPLS